MKPDLSVKVRARPCKSVSLFPLSREGVSARGRGGQGVRVHRSSAP